MTPEQALRHRCEDLQPYLVIKSAAKGNPPTTSWLMLDETVRPGNDTLVLKYAPDWRVEDWIVDTASGDDMEEAEIRQIKAISRNAAADSDRLGFWYDTDVAASAWPVIRHW